MNEKRLALVIKILIFAASLMPLIVMGGTFIFPFVFPKAIYFRIVVEIMLGLYVLLCFVNKEYLPRTTLIILAVLFWILTLLLATIFGADFSRSFWGNYERMSGWFTLLHFALYFVIVANVLRNWDDWKWLFRWSIILGLIVGCTGVNFLVPENSILRMGGGGSLGNSIYLSNFVLFTVLIAWYLFRKEKNKFWKGYAVLVGLLGVLLMLDNGKRGPFLGLVAAMILGVFFYIFLGRVKKWRIIGAGLLIFLVLFSALVYFNRTSKIVSQIPILNNLAATSLSGGTAETRLIAWNIAIQAWQERPVFGWGLENFYYAFNKYYNPRSLEHGYYETWFDRSHNIFFDYLSTSGILGLSGYLGLFGAVGWGLVKGYRKYLLAVKQNINKNLLVDLNTFIFLTMFLVAYGVQNIFVFDHLSSYLIFFLLIAFADFVYPQESVILDGKKCFFSNKKDIKKSPSFGLVIVTSLAVLFIIYNLNIKPAQANNVDFQAQKSIQRDFSVCLSLIKKALDMDSVHVVDIRNDFARAILNFANNPQARNLDSYKESFTFAVKELEKTFQEHPYEIQSPLLLGQFYALAGQYNQADQYFAKAKELSPHRQQIAFMWSRLKMAGRDYVGAIDLLNQTIDDDPQIPDPYWYLSLTFQEKGDDVLAWQNLKLALERGKSLANRQEVFFATNVFKKQMDWENLKIVLEPHLIQNPKDVQALLSLSEAYTNLGDKNKAQEMVVRAVILDPQAKETSKKWLK